MNRKVIMNVSVCSALTATDPVPSETCFGTAHVGQLCQGARQRASEAAGSSVRHLGGQGAANAPGGRLWAAQRLPALLRPTLQGGDTTTGSTGAPRVAETWLAAVVRFGEWMRSVRGNELHALQVVRGPARVLDRGTEGNA